MNAFTLVGVTVWVLVILALAETWWQLHKIHLRITDLNDKWYRVVSEARIEHDKTRRYAETLAFPASKPEPPTERIIDRENGIVKIAELKQEYDDLQTVLQPIMTEGEYQAGLAAIARIKAREARRKEGTALAKKKGKGKKKK